MSQLPRRHLLYEAQPTWLSIADASHAHPVGIASGIAIFWGCPWVPSAWLTAFLVGIGWVMRRRLGGIVIAACLGFSAAHIRTVMCWHSVPQLSYPIAAPIEGRVLQVQPRDSLHGRVVSSRVYLKITDSNKMPGWCHLKGATIVIKIDHEGFNLHPGDDVGLEVHLLPLPYQRRFAMYFEGISAQGSGKIRYKLPSSPQGVSGRLQKLRSSINNFFINKLSPQEAAIACALVTGDKGLISSEIHEFFRRSGLSHVLAISGLHVSLVMGLFFFFFRRILILIYPPYVLYVSPRRTAAALAWLSGFVYMMVAGAAFPVQRAFMMATLALGGLLMQRDSLGLHQLTSVASITLLCFPEAIRSISFQLSVSAVMGLMACQSFVKRVDSLIQSSVALSLWTKRLIRFSLGSFLSTAAACWGTLPFMWFHFHTLQLQGFVANALAIPFIAMCLMPLLVISLMGQGMSPVTFTRDGSWLVEGLSQALQGLIWIADTAANLPGILYLPPVPSWLYGVCGVGFLAWGLGEDCYINARWGKVSLRGMGMGVMILSLTTAPWGQTWLKPHILMSPSLMGVYIPATHELWTSKAFTSRYTLNEWLRVWGYPCHKVMPFTGSQPPFVCHQGTCVLTLNHHILSFWNQGNFSKPETFKKLNAIFTTSRRLCEKKRLNNRIHKRKNRFYSNENYRSIKVIRTWQRVPWGWRSLPLTPKNLKKL